MSEPRHTVLIVDDDFRVAAVHEGFVERVGGFRVVGTAHTAADAVRLGTALRPDVVLLDVYLPDGDGFGVVRDLHAAGSTSMFVVISAAGDADAVQQAVGLGAMQYLVKPFGYAAFAQRLESVRSALDRIGEWPDEPTQSDVDALFERLHRAGDDRGRALWGASPTLDRVYRVIVESGASMSATEIAAAIGISRATAQRYLTQLERTDLVRLDLRYGVTGRPENRYSVRAR